MITVQSGSTKITTWQTDSQMAYVEIPHVEWTDATGVSRGSILILTRAEMLHFEETLHQIMHVHFSRHACVRLSDVVDVRADCEYVGARYASITVRQIRSLAIALGRWLEGDRSVSALSIHSQDETVQIDQSSVPSCAMFSLPGCETVYLTDAHLELIQTTIGAYLRERDMQTR